MKVIKPLRLGVLLRAIEHRRRLALSVGIVAFFPFHSPATLLTEVARWKLAAPELAGALDTGMPKWALCLRMGMRSCRLTWSFNGSCG